MTGSPGVVYALRLRPGDDVLASLGRFRVDHGLRAAAIVTCVGSLTRAALRFANKPTTAILDGSLATPPTTYEIVSLVGTLSPEGDHVHISIADGEGRTTGGHLMPGSLVYTTAEIVLLEATALAFTRPIDPTTTYDELVVVARGTGGDADDATAAAGPTGDVPVTAAAATTAAAAATSGAPPTPPGSGGGGAGTPAGTAPA